MSLRLEYENKNVYPINNLKAAIETAVKATGDDERLFILPTYSAMLEVRKILVGRKFLWK